MGKNFFKAKMGKGAYFIYLINVAKRLHILFVLLMLQNGGVAYFIFLLMLQNRLFYFLINVTKRGSSISYLRL